MVDLSAFDLSHHTAVVTGASRGLGRAIATGLARAGARVVAWGRDPEALAETQRALAALGDHHQSALMDVRETDTVARAVAALEQVDIWVNNAGVEQLCPSLDVDEATWDLIVDTNLKGAFFCSQAAAKAMVAQGRGGAIVNLGSLASQVGIPTAVPYSSSKTGLLGMTRGLAAEWAPLGIRVNAIGPGYFRTQMTEPFYRDAAWQQSMLARIPAKRFGKPEDLVGAVVFLASPAAAYITGQLLFIDGGYTAAL
ncbi:MAG: SDR family NAD(P)-dependent oxidoreductase [Candidatus Competibacterales bacterium]